MRSADFLAALVARNVIARLSNEPRGVPADVVGILNRALVRVVGEPANRAQLNTLGLEAEAGTAEEYGAILRSESEKWSRLIREANIKP